MGNPTPGPWKVSVDGVRVFSATRTEWAVADCAPLGACPANMEANARLIASAPDLLEALEEALPLLEDDWFAGGEAGDADWEGQAWERVDAARKAIARARGGAA